MLIELFDRQNRLIGRVRQTDEGLVADSAAIERIIDSHRAAGKSDETIWEYLGTFNNGYMRGEFADTGA